MLKEDFIFSYEALAKLEDMGIYFAELDVHSYIDLVNFFWSCSDGKYTKDQILKAVLGGKIPVTVSEVIDNYVNDSSKK